MRRKVGICLGTALAALAATAAPALSENVGHGCVGKEVSATAHFDQQFLGMGFGAVMQSVGLNPGSVLHGFSDTSCAAP